MRRSIHKIVVIYRKRLENILHDNKMDQNHKSAHVQYE